MDREAIRKELIETLLAAAAVSEQLANRCASAGRMTEACIYKLEAEDLVAEAEQFEAEAL